MKKIALSLLAVAGVSFLIYSKMKLTDTSEPITLNAVEQTLVVNGKKKTVFNIVQPDGKEGFVGTKGERFKVHLVNKTSVPVSIHWHGIILPNDQDGVPYVTQLPIKPGESHDYNYPLLQAGTYWMHSHFKFHEQNLMSAPMILNDPHSLYSNDKDVVVMFQDFTFKNPEEIFYDLQHPKHEMNMHHKMGEDMSANQDLNDVKYDALLANRHTLRNPQIITVKPGEKVRLRLINGSAGSNFWVYTLNLEGTAIAVDGNDIDPIKAKEFQIAVAQRMDVEVTIPEKGGAFPILGQVEGTDQQAGIVLATKGAIIPKLNEKVKKIAPALDSSQEFKMHPLHPLDPRPFDTVLNFKLSGDMQTYVWKINDQLWPMIKPYKIKEGDRVEMVFSNDTGMAHPMHLHGHVFQVVEVNGEALENGPMRDTILVLPHTTQKIVFDANNPGIWMTHCHMLYHMAAGMMTTTNYMDFKAPQYYEDMINGKIKE